MKNTQNILIAFLLLFALTTVSAQKKIVKKGNQEFTDYSFIDAQEEYLRLANEGFRSEAMLKGLGDSFYFTADYINAAKWYGELYNYEGFDKTVDTEYLYRYAQSLKSSEEYEKASVVMREFQVASGEVISSEVGTDWLKDIDRNSGRFEIKNVDFNSSLSDFAPAYWKDNLVFASNRTEGKPIEKVHDWNNQPFLDLYAVILEGDTYGTTPKKLLGNINTQYHESTMVYSDSTDYVYFTRNNFNKNDFKTDKKGTNRLKLYRGKKGKNNKWKIEELPFNSNQYSVAHPALSPDQKTLYFASDMPGGFGNSDLYKVEILEDGSFGEIMNLGDKINTQGRDTFPFISPENTLYFASDSRDGLGGLDVYVTTLEDDPDAEIYNVGKPINSSQDDFGFILKNDLKTGYFTSNREGGKGFDDIYSFVRLRPIQTECIQYVKGIVKDKNSGKVIPGATVTLRNDDNELLAEELTDDNGAFDLGSIQCEKYYVARATKEGYSIAEERFKSTAELDLELNLELGLTPKVVTPTIALGTDLAKLLDLENINFDYDKSFIRPDAAAILQRVVNYMNEYPTVKIDVRSHTDARGSDAYNMALSQRRNVSTREWLINQGGIDRSRISGRGYGETQLINECANGVKCTDEVHEQNRRSEFIVVQK